MTINEPTPNGGDYSELLYFDKDGKVIESFIDDFRDNHIFFIFFDL